MDAVKLAGPQGGRQKIPVRRIIPSFDSLLSHLFAKLLERIDNKDSWLMLILGSIMNFKDRVESRISCGRNREGG